MQTGLHLSIHAFEPATWDALNPSCYPGLLHGFLSALEDSKSVGEGTGWRPLYASVTAHDELVGAMVCYLKSDSYGEYVFDWAWADAYHRHGLNYYPKCITAIPFTPASGPRVLIKHDADEKEIMRLLIETLKKELTGRVSSWHILYPNEESHQCFQSSDAWLERFGVQFHWFNQGFTNFDDHLATFNSKRRKEVRRERRRVAEQGITFERLSGHEIDSDALDTLFQCYQMTYRIRGSLGYLTREFFEYAVERIPEAIRVAFAIHQGKRIAMSFCLRDQQTLYGRYWGALYDVDCLHFETCFHQWIEDAIAQGIERFDPGAQGEHKIARG
ncbi:MAG: GNAT family N-acetyltransferase, partial [Gammaproteobacteria bacterium]